MGSHVEICEITKAYLKGKPVLRPVSFDIAPGELFFLLGSSGCGKSTLLRIIAGLLRPDSGKILFDGKDITNLAPEKRRAAMVFQNYALWPIMNVFENVAFGLRSAGKFTEKEIRERVESALESVRLQDLAKRNIPSLSGGQQQRIALARALAVDPAVLLLDEPLSNLDARLRDEMRLEIRRICKERNLTAIYVTHDRREALSMADRIAVLDGGTIRQIGTPGELYRTPVERFVANFLGDANFLTGTVSDVQGDSFLLNTPAGNFRVSGTGPENGQTVDVMLRPAAFTFRRMSPQDCSLKATIREGTYLGERTEWIFDSACGQLLVSETLPPDRACGQEYELFFSPENLVLLSRSCR